MSALGSNLLVVPEAAGQRRAQAPAQRQARVISSLEAAEAVAPAWNALAELSGNPTGLHSWAVASAHALEPARRLAAVAIEEGTDLVALAPLMRRPGTRTRLEPAGLEQVFEPADFLYRDSAGLERLAQEVRRSGHPLFLWRVPAQGAVEGALRTAFRGRGTVTTRPAWGCPFIQLDESWEAPEDRFGSRRRSDFRRARRRAEALGAVELEVHAPSPGEVGALMAEAVAVEAACWKGQSGTALAHDGAKRDFFEAWVRAAAAEGSLRMCFLRIDGEPAAMQIATESGGRFWLLKIGYDERFAKASPGQLLMLHTLGYAARRGLQSYEFLGTPQPWTRAWTEDVREYVSLRAFPAHWRAVPEVLARGARRTRSVRRQPA